MTATAFTRLDKRFFRATFDEIPKEYILDGVCREGLYAYYDCKIYYIGSVADMLGDGKDVMFLMPYGPEIDINRFRNFRNVLRVVDGVVEFIVRCHDVTFDGSLCVKLYDAKLVAGYHYEQE